MGGNLLRRGNGEKVPFKLAGQKKTEKQKHDVILLLVRMGRRFEEDLLWGGKSLQDPAGTPRIGTIDVLHRWGGWLI